MEQQRPLLFIALALVLFLLWDAWQRDHSPIPVVPPPKPAVTQQGMPADEVPMGSDQAAVTVAGKSTVPAAISSGEVLKTAQRIEVLTDNYRAEIDSIGGDLRLVKLRKYPIKPGKPDEPFELMNDSLPNLFVSQSGFTLKKDRGDGTHIAAPNHTTIYKTAKTHYVLKDGEDAVNVDLNWSSPEGVEFTKRYVFKRDSYVIDVQHIVNNKSAKDWRGNTYQQLQRTQVSEVDQSQFIYTYMGGVIYSPEEKYQKIKFSDMQESDLKMEVTGGWTAMIQHYFLGAWIPKAEEAQVFYTQFKKDNTRYVIGMRSATEHRVAAGSQQVLASRLFVGPKLQNTLEDVTPGLELTVDYGFLTFIAKPLFWLLDHIHSLVKNWGWAIILLTLLIKLVFYKLSEASYKSMANMRRVQPRLMALKERYGGDRQKMNQALMGLYKEEKINPLGGCLPILIQIPVFIALYWVLLESVEMRQAEWILWIKDMSSADPYYILPLIMGITMFFQQKLNPAPMDPIQAKVMMVLPVVFTIFFAFFPAGLVLYWVANNILSIAQQWYITRIVIKS